MWGRLLREISPLLALDVVASCCTLIERLRGRAPGELPRVAIMTGSGQPDLPGIEVLTNPFGRKEVDALFEPS